MIKSILCFFAFFVKKFCIAILVLALPLTAQEGPEVDDKGMLALAWVGPSSLDYVIFKELVFEPVHLDWGYLGNPVTALPLTAQEGPEVDDKVMRAITWVVASALGSGIVLDGGATFNAWGDEFERVAFGKIGLNWNTLGNPVTWFHHGLAEAALIETARLAAHLTGADPDRWARIWGWAGVGLYAVREIASLAFPRPDAKYGGPAIGREFPYTNRWVDALGDATAPLGVFLWLTR